MTSHMCHIRVNECKLSNTSRSRGPGELHRGQIEQHLRAGGPSSAGLGLRALLFSLGLDISPSIVLSVTSSNILVCSPNTSLFPVKG